MYGANITTHAYNRRKIGISGECVYGRRGAGLENREWSSMFVRHDNNVAACVAAGGAGAAAKCACGAMLHSPSPPRCCVGTFWCCKPAGAVVTS